MRILITGCTPQHTGKPHPLNYALTSHLLAEGLRGSGHQVDQRAVGPGEKKLRREYDHALVYRFNPEAGSARHILGALYTLVEFPRAWDSRRATWASRATAVRARDTCASRTTCARALSGRSAHRGTGS